MSALRVGLTGGIASGKSSVGERLAARGAVVIDSDLLAREVVAPGSAGLQAVVERFGAHLVDDEGRLDRPALGAVIFGDTIAKRDLEAIIHPRVRGEAAALEAAAASDAVVVQMIPLLVETGQTEAFDVLAVVDVAAWVQRDRLARRDRLEPAQVEARLAAQASRGERLRVADVVIDNSGDLADLDAVVGCVWDLLLRRAAR